MAVRIRMKKMGRRRRPFFRVCAVDAHASRDGKVIEYLGHYDPMVKETDARAILKGDRISYWLSVGALPTEKVQVLIKKYGSGGTHLEQQKSALERAKASKQIAPPPPPMPKPRKEKKEQAPEAAGEAVEETAEAAGPEESSS